MAYPAAPQDANSVNFTFLTTDGNAGVGWVAVETGTPGTGSSNTVGWAGVATHVEGDEVADPGDITTGAAPVVLVAGDDGTNAVPLQMEGNFLRTVIEPNSFAAVEGAALGEGVLLQGDDTTDRKNINVDATTGDIQVDITEVVPGFGAADLGKREDDIHASLDVGVQMLAVRKATPVNLSGADGDYEPPQIDTGSLWVKDNNLATVLGTASLTDGSNHLQCDIAASSATVTTNATLQTGSNVVGEVTIGVATTAATDLAKAEDVAHGSGDVGIQMLAVRKATPADLSGTDGDYEPLQIDNGRLWTDSNVAGAVAHDAVDSGNPVKIGGQASGAERSAVATGDRVDAWFDPQGRLVTAPSHPINDGPFFKNVTSAASDTELVAAPGASVHIYVTNIMVGNKATSVSVINIAEETTGTASNIKLRMPMAADGGGFVRPFNPPWKIPANKALVCDLSATGDCDVNIDWYEAGDIAV